MWDGVGLSGVGAVKRRWQTNRTAHEISIHASAARDSTPSMLEPTTTGLLKLSLPVLYAIVLRSIGISINSFWIGHYLGGAAFAAVSEASSILMILYGITSGAATAAGILIGRAVGCGSMAEARRIVGTSVTIFAMIAVVLGALGIVTADYLLKLVGAPESSMGMAAEYLRVMLLSLPATYLYALVVSMLYAVGSSKMTFWFISVAIVLEMVLNPPLIFGVRELHGLGVVGSGLANLTAQSVGLLLLIGHLYSRKHFLCIREIALLRVDWRVAAALARNGLPINAQILVVALQQVLFLSLVNRYGVNVVAAYSAALQIWFYLQMPACAIGIGVTSMVSQYVGGGACEKAKRLIPASLACSILITGAAVIVVDAIGTRAFWPFLSTATGGPILAMHINEEVSWSFVLCCIYTVLFAAANAKGDVWGPVAILAGVLAARYPITEAALDRWHADAIWWSFPSAAAATSALALLYQRYRNFQIKNSSGALVLTSAPVQAQGSGRGDG